MKFDEIERNWDIYDIKYRVNKCVSVQLSRLIWKWGKFIFFLIVNCLQIKRT